MRNTPLGYSFAKIHLRAIKICDPVQVYFVNRIWPKSTSYVTQVSPSTSQLRMLIKPSYSLTVTGYKASVSR